ncbi:pectinesterase [Amylostereum chailletii]|nr:pectinesterase [Amylostereum chailletii]
MLGRWLLSLFCLALSATALSPPTSRTTPPTGALIVRAGTTTSGEFATLAKAVAALPADSSSQTIFLYPGTYTGQVLIQRSGPVTLLGYSTKPGDANQNQAVLTAGVSATQAGSDDLSGTLRIHTDRVAIYNLDIHNTFGQGSQAIALSNYGNQVGVYGCRLFGYQDTLLTEQGLHVYLQGYIEGAVDFIFGQTRRTSNDAGIYLFNSNKVQLTSGAASNTAGNFFLGRPWGDFARVIFKGTTVTATINPALWSIWNKGDPRTDDVVYGDFGTTGAGATSLARAGFSTELSASQAATYTISSALGSSYTSWVDTAWLI